MSNTSVHPKIGEIYVMYFSGSKNEQSGWRPGLIFQNNTGNTFSPNVIALPLTTAIKKSYMPTHVIIAAEDSGLKTDSMVLCENPECMSKDRIGRYITTVSDEYMERVAIASLLATSAIAFIKPETLRDLWNRAVALNSVPSDP